MTPGGDVTQLLAEAKAGDKDAENRVLSLVYDELRRIAHASMRRERDGHTLQATELAHEAYIRLVANRKDWENRAHFYAIAAKTMRRILVDYARARNALKRPQGKRVDLNEMDLRFEIDPTEVLALDRALTKLAEWDARRSRVVEMRIFGGLSETEIANVLDIGVRTVKRDWSLARAWLYGELRGKTKSADGAD
jgi:RNA polymerase sigma factor (TIGR02999 family)